jgi:hypothetical protein
LNTPSQANLNYSLLAGTWWTPDALSLAICMYRRQICTNPR